LKRAIGSGQYWDFILEIARKYQAKLLAYEHFLPAVRQAIEVMLTD